MSTDAQEFTYGRRIHVTQNVTAQPRYDVKPLSPEDFLNPQEGDEFNHGERHKDEVDKLAAVLRHHYRYNPATSIVEGAIVRWNETNLPAPMPDIAVVADLPATTRRITTLDLRQSIARVRVIFEITSPHFAEFDLKQKVQIYQQAAVPEYWVIDTGLRPDQPQPAYTIHAWQLEQSTYVPIRPDDQGRYVSENCRTWLRIAADHQQLEVGDLRTDTIIDPAAEETGRATGARAEASARAKSIADQLKF